MSKVQHNTIRKFIVLAVSLLTLVTACQPVPPSSSGSGVETIVAQTLEAFTAAAPTSVPANGSPVSYQNISFTIPLELNASVTPATRTDVEFPYINPSGGPMAEHAIFPFNNYPVQGDAKVMVFKASDYGAYGEPLQKAVTALVAGQDTAPPLSKSLLQGEFYAQAKPVSFKNGHGVRYLTQVLMNYGPITNEDLFYYYQGITNDGAYFVSAIFHVNAPFLVANSSKDSPAPPDGVPFVEGTDLDFSAYLSAVTQKLNDAPAQSFTPSLLTLDRLIESIEVTTP